MKMHPLSYKSVWAAFSYFVHGGIRVLSESYSNKPPWLISYRTALTLIDDITASSHPAVLLMKNHAAEFSRIGMRQHTSFT